MTPVGRPAGPRGCGAAAGLLLWALLLAAAAPPARAQRVFGSQGQVKKAQAFVFSGDK
jgi:hypothetical protein